MKNIKYILPAALIALSSCSEYTHHAGANAAKSDSTLNTSAAKAEQEGLYATLKVKDTLNSTEPVALTFTVYNNADTAARFCKWHTPFEPLMSKYLDVTNAAGEEVAYKGAMAKRIMPPPASSYLMVKPNDSLSVKVDLLKGYDMAAAGKYSIKYNSQAISGLIVKDSVSVLLIK